MSYWALWTRFFLQQKVRRSWKTWKEAESYNSWLQAQHLQFMLIFCNLIHFIFDISFLGLEYNEEIYVFSSTKVNSLAAGFPLGYSNKSQTISHHKDHSSLLNFYLAGCRGKKSHYPSMATSTIWRLGTDFIKKNVTICKNENHLYRDLFPTTSKQ